MLFSKAKEMNRLISKGTSNIYLKVTNEKNWRSQNVDFLSLKIFSPSQLLGSSNSHKYHWIFNLKIRGQGAKGYVTSIFFFFFFFERNYGVLKSKSPCILLNKTINSNKNKRESKMKKPTHPFREMNLVHQLI